MSVTVADCLKLPSLKEATVVAGKNGLDKIVSAVSVLEYADPVALSHNFFIGNEIILTAFVSVKDDVPTQCKTIERLHGAGEVAVILYYVEVFLPSVDEKLIALGDKLNFPIIVMPMGRLDFRYSDFIIEVMEAIFLDKQRDTYFVNSILDRISQLSPHQRTIGTVMRMLSDQLRCTLLLCDTYLKPLGFAKWPMSNSINEEMITEFFRGQPPVDSDPISFTQSIGGAEATMFREPFKDIQNRHLNLIGVDETGTVNEQLLRQATELIQLFANIWKYNLDYVQPDALVPAVLNDQPDKMRLIAQSFKIDMSVINTMLLVNIDSKELSSMDRHILNEKLAIKARLFLKERDKPIIADVHEGILVVFVEYAKSSDFDEGLMDNFFEVLRGVNPHITLTVCGNLATTTDARKFYILYKESFDLVCRIYPKRNLFTTFELEFAMECLSILNMPPLEQSRYTEALLPLHTQDDAAELLDTLGVYLLDAGSSSKDTGEILFLHRNTVQYRLNKIKQRLHYDINKMPESYTIYRAIALERIKKDEACPEKTQSLLF